MRRFFKMIALVMITVLTLSLLACGNSKSGDDKDKQAEQKTQEESENNSKEVLKELSAKITLSAAWDAVVAYGSEQYDEFAVQNSPSQPVDETAEDAATWHLKAGCIVDGETKTCEARVTGTTENPEVLSFDIY